VRLQKTILKVIFLLCSLSNYFLTTAQKIPLPEAKDRVTMTKNDTLYRFHATKPPKKFKIVEDARYAWYISDTILVTKAGFSERLLNGPFEIFYPNNNLYQSGYYKYGLKNGLWKSWHLNGQLMQTELWKNGQLNGSFAEYSQNGIKVKEGNYKNGLLNGELIEYMPGEKKRHIQYRAGVIVEPKVKQTSKTDSTSSAPKAQ
jgi:hypothetical protein